MNSNTNSIIRLKKIMIGVIVVRINAEKKVIILMIFDTVHVIRVIPSECNKCINYIRYALCFNIRRLNFSDW